MEKPESLIFIWFHSEQPYLILKRLHGIILSEALLSYKAGSIYCGLS